MKRSSFITCVLIAVFLVVTSACGAFAQPAAVTVVFSEQELDQMLAPIALYPDSLLAQILIAATYPDQVMEENHWLRANPCFKGTALNEALDRMNWDLSVKALAPFPQVVAMMAQRPDWTRRLGEAFLSQQADVMNSVQRLRRRAEEAGNLRSSAEQRVVVERDYIEIAPVNPDVVYIPRYNPVVVYGTWWWPAYPPFAFYPVWPGVAVSPVGVFGYWGAVMVGPVWSWGWGSWGWGSHNVYLNVNRNININTTNVTVVSNMRRSMRTTGLRQAVVSGRFGSRSGTWARARTTLSREGRRTTGVRRSGFGVRGQRGATGHGFRTRPSAATVRNELRGGRIRGGGRAGSVGRTTGSARQSYGTRTGRTGQRTGTYRSSQGRHGRTNSFRQSQPGRTRQGLTNRGFNRGGSAMTGNRMGAGMRTSGRTGGQFRRAGATRGGRAMRGGRSGAGRGGNGAGRRDRKHNQ